MAIKFGPAGMGSVKDVEETFKRFKELGLKAAEIPFTYGIFINTEEKAKKVRKAAEKYGIDLSIHAQYWINFNSSEKQKIVASKQRILECLKIGTWLNAKRVVFHAGFFGKKTKEETYENIKNEILDLQRIRKENKYTPELAPETMGKINVFGSVEEISRLVKDTGCSFCIDFAHILARYKNYSFDEVEKHFGKYKNWHLHFSGIEYNEKGERRHKITLDSEWKKILDNLPKDKNIIIINESPDPVNDAVKGERLHKKLFQG